jgi:hypothetical protein
VLIEPVNGCPISIVLGQCSEICQTGQRTLLASGRGLLVRQDVPAQPLSTHQPVECDVDCFGGSIDVTAGRAGKLVGFASREPRLGYSTTLLERSDRIWSGV